MNDMDINDIRKKKKELESKIYHLIDYFEGETDVEVVDISLITKTIKIYGSDKTEQERTIDVKLEEL